MLFWIFVIATAVCFGLGIYFRNKGYKPDKNYYKISGNCFSAIILLSAVLILMILILVYTYFDILGDFEKWNQQYENLTYQVEHEMYSNDNEYCEHCKKELMNEVREWNESLIWYQTLQKDFWIGIFIPNVYDQFKLIDYSNMK